MPSILDQTADTDHRDLYRYSKLYDLPEYVKQASADLVGPERYKNAASSLFADVRNRQFPIDTKAATALSWLHFLDKQAEIHPVMAGWIEERLTHFAEFHKISSDVSKFRAKHASLQAAGEDDYSRLPDSAFAVVGHNSDGSHVREYPLRNALEVVKAAEWFAEYRDHFPFDYRQQIADRLITKAAQFAAHIPAELGEMLEKQAGRGVYNPKEVADMIRNRVKAAVHAESTIREHMTKLAQQVEDSPQMAMDPAMCLELCKTVDTFDRATKMAGKYDEVIPRPEDVIFKGSLKLAAEFVQDSVPLVNGTVYERPQFAKLALSDVRDIFGDDIANAVSDGLQVNAEKMAELASTLPLADAVTLDKLMTAAGQTSHKQASAKVGLSKDELYRLAKMQQELGI